MNEDQRSYWGNARECGACFVGKWHSKAYHDERVAERAA